MSSRRAIIIKPILPPDNLFATSRNSAAVLPVEWKIVTSNRLPLLMNASELQAVNLLIKLLILFDI
jgi:hypothetical protein